MRKNVCCPRVFFNASVIIAGFVSSSGGSAELLRWVKKNKITGIISEIIYDEVIRNADKIRLSPEEIKRRLFLIFSKIIKAPDEKQVKSFYQIVIDFGDTHVLASSIEAKADFLVTLDKKHLLILDKKIKGLKIVSPRKLIEILIKRQEKKIH